MALDWPNTPTTGSVYTPAGSNVSWMWDGTKWTNVSGLVAPSGRNFLHNALYNVQQRGQGSWSNTSYTADRWGTYVNADTATTSIVTLGDTDRAAIGDEAASSAMQIAFTGTTGAGAQTAQFQKIEDVRRTSGKQVTAQFWARATVGTPRVGVASMQAFGTGGSPSTNVFTPHGTTPALSNTWQHYVVTGTVPSVAGKTLGTTAGTSFEQFTLILSDQANAYGTGIGVQSGTVQFWGMQLELGTAATPLEKLDPDTDWSHCQRFYQLTDINVGGYGQAGTSITIQLPFAVAMRAVPTLALTQAGTLNNASGATFDSASPRAFRAYSNVTATGNSYWTGAIAAASADL